MFTRVLRWLLGGFIVFIFISIGAMFFLNDKLNLFVKEVVERNGVEALGTNVEIGEVDVTLATGKGLIHDLRIYNPEGFSDQPAFTVERLYFETNFQNINQAVIGLKLVRAENTTIEIEFNDQGESNLHALRADIDKQAKNGHTTFNSRKIIIDSYSSINRKAILVINGEKKHEFKLPDLPALNNIGLEEGGIPLSQVLTRIFNYIIPSTLEDVKKRENNEQTN